MKVVVTGGTGFIGANLIAFLLDRGYEVHGLSRDPERARAREPRATWFAYDLAQPPEGGIFAGGVDALVHTAYESEHVEHKRGVNLAAMRALVAACRENGVSQIVLTSSMSAHEDAQSHYGRSKLEMEACLNPERDVALRLGFVIGAGGIFQRLAQTIRQTPAVPLFYGGRQMLQTVAIADVLRAVAVSLQKHLTGVRYVAAAEALPLRDFYRQIAARQGKKPAFVPIPGHAALMALRICERLGISLPFTSENLLGLKALRAFDVSADLEALGFRPQGTSQTLQEFYET